MPRPFILDPLFRSLTALPGIGEKNATYFERLIGGPKVLDLFWHLPIDLIDRRFTPTITEAPEGKIATITISTLQHIPNQRKGQPYRVKVIDESGPMTLTFFHQRKDWMEKLLPPNEQRIVSGMIELYQGQKQIVHPEIAKPEDRVEIERIEAVYPLTQGLTNKTVTKALAGAIKLLPDLPEWLDSALMKQQGWDSWKECLREAHLLSPSPESLSSFHSPKDSSSPRRGEDSGALAELGEGVKKRARLAYDELLSNQLTMAIVRQNARKANGRSFEGNGELQNKLIAALPFSLTGAQERSLSEIDEDMREPLKMLRLLQGDVGSGKTVVAALSMLKAIECGAQGALLAPTEILARQHADTLKPLLDQIGVQHVILTGRDKGKAREALLEQIQSGAAQIVIGTHAIFQEGVEFDDLGLAVIDEQHRFGVHQRLALSDKGASKGKATDVLVMTATPIPRTLTLTAYGDMDVSRLDEKPPGRKPIDTRLIAQDSLDKMIAGLQRQIASGARIYWVCPLVEDSEVLDLTSAEERYDVLHQTFGERAGLVHGRMKPQEKDAVMERFAAGDLDILVATTVIEVGVNVPEATIMVIEHAERFGLSQLHQLRGRVGRGGNQSYCFLLYKGPLGEIAKERLSIMRETEDGFLIAEKDLELRGAGDVLGVKQSGLPKFRLADLEAHKDLIKMASDDARLIVEKDLLNTSNTDLTEGQKQRGEALRTLLYLFERDQAIQYLQSG